MKNIENPSCFAFLRKTTDDQVLLIMNASIKEQRITTNTDEISWEDGRRLNDLINPSKQYITTNHTIEITLPALRGMWLV